MMQQKISFLGLSTMPIDRRVVACFTIDDRVVYQGRESVRETARTLNTNRAYVVALHMLNHANSLCVDDFPKITSAETIANELEINTIARDSGCLYGFENQHH